MDQHNASREKKDQILPRKKIFDIRSIVKPVINNYSGVTDILSCRHLSSSNNTNTFIGY